MPPSHERGKNGQRSSARPYLTYTLPTDGDDDRLLFKLLANLRARNKARRTLAHIRIAHGHMSVWKSTFLDENVTLNQLNLKMIDCADNDTNKKPVEVYWFVWRMRTLLLPLFSALIPCGDVVFDTFIHIDRTIDVKMPKWIRAQGPPQVAHLSVFFYLHSLPLSLTLLSWITRTFCLDLSSSDASGKPKPPASSLRTIFIFNKAHTTSAYLKYIFHSNKPKTMNERNKVKYCETINGYEQIRIKTAWFCVPEKSFSSFAVWSSRMTFAWAILYTSQLVNFIYYYYLSPPNGHSDWVKWHYNKWLKSKCLECVRRKTIMSNSIPCSYYSLLKIDSIDWVYVRNVCRCDEARYRRWYAAKFNKSRWMDAIFIYIFLLKKYYPEFQGLEQHFHNTLWRLTFLPHPIPLDSDEVTVIECFWLRWISADSLIPAYTE